MEINTQNNVFDTNTGRESVNSSNQSDERNLFMSLLVAQLKNQDPLSPKDGTEFVAQLAQFNSLDQLIGIRDAIERLDVQTQTPDIQISAIN